MRAHASHRLESVLRVGLATALFASTVGMMWTTLVEVFDRTRAVPPEEFPASEFMFAQAPRFAAIQLAATACVLLCATGLAVGRHRRGALGPGLGAALGVVVAGALAAHVHGMAALAAAAALYAAHLIDVAERPAEPGEAAFVDALDALTMRHLAARAGPLVGLPILAFAVCVGLELALYTAPFAGRFFPAEAFPEFAAMALGAAVLSGVRFALELACLLGLMRALTRELDGAGARWALAVALWAVPLIFLATPATWGPLRLGALFGAVALLGVWSARTPTPGVRLVAVSALPALYLYARTTDLFLAALRDEAAALDLTWMVYLLFGFAGLLVAVWTHTGLRGLAQRVDGSPVRARDLFAALAVSVVDPAAGWIARRAPSFRVAIRRAALGAGCFLALWLLVLVELNYPSFTDFSQFLQRLYSLLIGYAVWALVAVIWLAWFGGRGDAAGAERWRGPALLAVLALAAGAAFWPLQGSQMNRFVASQYTKIARRAADLARVVQPPPRIDLADDARVGDDVAPLTEATLPPLPPALADYWAERRPMIVIVVWDAARADHMSAYGYARDTTPGARRLAQDGIRFDRAYSGATGTTASLRHLLSGRFSTRYMLAQDHAPFFTGRLFEDGGYDRFFVNILGSDFNGVSRDAFVRNQGLDDAAQTALEAGTTEFGAYEEQTKTAAALALLDGALAERQDRAHPSDGLVFFLHSTATHWPWQAWDDAPDYGTELVDLYDQAMFHADKATADFLDGLRARGIYDDTLVVLTADHGTGLDDHGLYGGFEPWEEQIRVPLIVKLPGIAGPKGGKTHRRVVPTPVTAIDLGPTLVNLVAPGAESGYDGLSMLPLVFDADDAPAKRRRWIVSLSAFEDALALIDLERGLKLHVHRADRYEQLYDLHADPEELHNLADARPDDVAAMMDWLQRFLWHRRTSIGNPFHYRDARDE